jgi:ubiquinone/menaquinone biosynthesis C-methylase UbiE
MDSVYSDFFAQAVGVDIDERAVEYARKNFNRPNLRFEVGDGLNLPFVDNSFDVVVCSQVYEHVPDQQRLMGEIWRVLSEGGVCYFSATNRFIVVEPHYRLWFLSWLPPKLADVYVRLAKKGTRYYERMRSLPKLRRLVGRFSVSDYTIEILRDPVGYNFDYVIKPASFSQRVSIFIASRLPWICPGFIWILKKDFV